MNATTSPSTVMSGDTTTSPPGTGSGDASATSRARRSRSATGAGGTEAGAGSLPATGSTTGGTPSEARTAST